MRFDHGGTGGVFLLGLIGEMLAAIELPVSHPTCCCFGGPALDRLYVTSASEPLSESQRADEPLAGRVLELDLGIRGQPEYRAGL